MTTEQQAACVDDAAVGRALRAYLGTKGKTFDKAKCAAMRRALQAARLPVGDAVAETLNPGEVADCVLIAHLRWLANIAYENGAHELGYDPISEVERRLPLAEKLQAFKDYIHERLDGMGVPVDPESPHKAAGCRVGGRLDYVERFVLPVAGDAVRGLVAKWVNEIDVWPTGGIPGAVRATLRKCADDLERAIAVTATPAGQDAALLMPRSVSLTREEAERMFPTNTYKGNGDDE